MTKKTLSVLLVILLLTSNLPVFAAPSAWAELGVSQLMDQELIPTDLQSDYQKYITRGEFARLLIPVMEAILSTDRGSTFEYQVTKEPFVDTNETNVMKAYSSDIIGGMGNNKFNPNGLITREQVAIMMANAVDTIEMLSYVTEKPIVTDDKDISNWAKAYVYVSLTNGLMNGTGKGNYAPKANVTREQAILMVNNVVNNYLNAESIAAHWSSIQTKYSNNIADYKSEMIWKLLGSKPLKVDLMDVIGKETNSLSSTFGISDGEGFAKFLTLTLDTGGITTDTDGSSFVYDAEIINYATYGIDIYHTDGKIIGFALIHNEAFDGSISGFQTVYDYEEAVELLSNTEKLDIGGEMVYGEINGYHLSIYFEDISQPSIDLSVVKLK